MAVLTLSISRDFFSNAHIAATCRHRRACCTWPPGLEQTVMAVSLGVQAF